MTMRMEDKASGRWAVLAQVPEGTYAGDWVCELWFGDNYERKRFTTKAAAVIVAAEYVFAVEIGDGR